MTSIHRPASRFVLRLAAPAALAGLMACERAPSPPDRPPQPEVAQVETSQAEMAQADTAEADTTAPPAAPAAPGAEGHDMHGQTFEDAVRDAQS